MTRTIDKSLQFPVYGPDAKEPIPITWEQAEALVRGETIMIGGKELTADDGPFGPGEAELDLE